MAFDELSAISRRNLIGASLGLGGLALAGASSPVGAASMSGADAPDPVTLHRKLRFRTDAGLVFWWLQGVKYGQVGTTLTPLYTLLTGTIQRIVPTADGGFDMTMLEMSVKLDVEGIAPLREWVNPYTGEVLPTTFNPIGPTTVHYRADDSRVLPTELGGARLESEAQISPPVIVHDDIFFSEQIRAKVFRPEREEPFVVNDMSHYHGSLREVSDPRVTMASARVSFAEITGWQSWMNMGSRPGNLTSRSFGAKVAEFAMLPAQWRELLAQKAPEIAADPAGSLDKPAAEFVR